MFCGGVKTGMAADVSLHRSLLFFVLSFQTFLPITWRKAEAQQNERPSASWTWDPNGYVLYCPCMGRFGNQADHFLGALAFAKSLNRTLALAPWRTYRNVPFKDFFQVDPLQEFHRVIPMEDFMEHLAPTHWPQGNRRGYCWLPPSSDDSCKMKVGNPFQPFWDELGVDFDSYESYYLMYNLQDSYVKKQWEIEFPPSQHPVLAFKGAPASFPVSEHNVKLHAYLQWSPKINDDAENYIREHLPQGPFVGIHLRNGVDWKNACEHVNSAPQFMASPQCLGYTRYHTVSRELCFPPKELILNQTEAALRDTGAGALYVATDEDPMLEDFQKRFQGLQVGIFYLNPWLPQLDLAILGKADYFIGNCVSSFTAFVKRERDVNGKPSAFWAYDPGTS